jgi:hypothetical protein
MKRIIVIGIICIFLLTSLNSISAKEINSNLEEKASNPESVEIPVKIFGDYGVNTYKIQLTQQEKADFDSIIEEFKSDLESAKTLKKTIKIYHNMVVSLDDFGMLPEGMNVKRVQRLVTGRFNIFNNIGFFSNKIIADKSQQPSGDIFENSNCLVSGSSTESGPYNPYLFVGWIRWLIYSLTGFWIGPIYYGWYSPLSGFWEFANGWIKTHSLQKKWDYEGNFVGYLDWDGTDKMGYYIGITGFIGMCYGDYYFGTARHVKIGTDIW